MAAPDNKRNELLELPRVLSTIQSDEAQAKSANEQLLRGLFEFAPDAMVVVNEDARIERVNMQTTVMFGYSREELLGQYLEMLLPERFRERHIGHRTNYLTGPRTRPMGAGLELLGRRKDASEFPVDIMLSPLEVAGGSMVIGIVRDITERKRFEQRLQETNAELENANFAKDRFLASMSHELRTPLNAILGFTGTLLMKLPGPLTDDQHRQLTTIKSSAKHLLSLINDLLDLAKIESGKVELHLEPVDCLGMVEEIANSLQPLAREKGICFGVRLPEGALVLRTDRRALSQILLNLSNNAIKFTDKGSVNLEVTQSNLKGETFTSFQVTDTGVGIRDEDREKLFKAFSQVDAGNRRYKEGTGLGLHLSQKLAELLGGNIACESEHGNGSTFTLTLVER
jgi:protein-histidine pros-kinase